MPDSEFQLSPICSLSPPGLHRKLFQPSGVNHARNCLNSANFAGTKPVPRTTADLAPLDVCISTSFHSQEGQQLGVVGSLQDWDVSKALPLIRTEDRSLAHLSLPRGSSFEFKFILSYDSSVDWEPGLNHHIDLPSSSKPKSNLLVDCSWGNAEDTVVEDEDDMVECQIIVPLLAASSTQTLKLVGSSRSLGRWKHESGLKLSRKGDAWVGCVSLPASKATEAKLVLVDGSKGCEVQWEGGEGNRIIQPLSSSLIILHWGITSYAKILPLNPSQTDMTTPLSDCVEVTNLNPYPPSSLYEFEVPCYVTRPGQSLKLVGSIPELGAWDPHQALNLQWKPGHAWSACLPLPAAEGSIEAKVIFNENGHYSWEPGSNRRIDLPALLSSTPGSGSINSSSNGLFSLYWGHTESTPLIVVPSEVGEVTLGEETSGGFESESVIDVVEGTLAEVKDAVKDEKADESIVQSFFTMALSGLMIPNPAHSSSPPMKNKEDQSQIIDMFKSEISALKAKLSSTTDELHSARKLALDQWGFGSVNVDDPAMKEKEKVQKLLHENERLDKRIKEILAAVDELRSSNQAIRTDAENKAMMFEKKMTLGDKEKRELEYSLSGKDAKIASMRATIAELERARVAYTKASEESTRAEADLRSQLSDALARRDVAVAELKRSRQDAADAAQGFQIKINSLEKISTSDLEAWSKRVSSLEGQLKEKSQEAAALTSQSEAYASSINQLKIELSEAMAASSSLTSQVKELQSLVESHLGTISRLEAEKKKLELTISHHKKQEAVSPSLNGSESNTVKGGEVADLRSQLLKMQNQVAEVKAEETKRRVQEATQLRKEFESRITSQRNLLLAAKASDVSNLTQKHEAEIAMLTAQVQQLQDQIEALRSQLNLADNMVPPIATSKATEANKGWGGWWFGNKKQTSISSASKEDNESLSPSPPVTRLQAPKPTQPKVEDEAAKKDMPARVIKPLVDYLDIVD